MSSDSKMSNRDEPRRQRGAWRFLARTTAVFLILGAGWIAGIKTQERPEIGAFLGRFGGELLAALQEQPADDQAPGSSSSVAVASDLERIRRPEAASEGLRSKIDGLASSIDGNQRQLLAKLEEFSERLHRIERNGSDTAGRLVLLNESLEHSVPIASAPTQPAPPAIGVTPAAKAVGAPVQASVPAPTLQRQERTQAQAETKKVAQWAVREVTDGKATLQGPGGVIVVSVGDLVPGVGRVQSMGRQGGRWTIATNKGLITAR